MNLVNTGSCLPQLKQVSGSQCPSNNWGIQDFRPEMLDCVVIGGGVAGLQCARSLVDDFGLLPSNVLLLEAAKRIGGCALHS